MKCDVETVEAELLALVKSKLPAKIAEITAEKADSIVLEVPTDSQYFNSTDDDIDNRTLSFRYGAEDQDANSIGAATAEDNTYLFLISLNEMNQHPGINRKKLFRYSRALKEIFNENSNRFPHLSSMMVATIAPQSWAKNEEAPVYKVAGVYVKTSIAS